MHLRHIPVYIRYRLGFAFLIIIVGLVAWQIIHRSSTDSGNNQTAQAQKTERAFAAVSTAGLDATQLRILTIIKQEYTKSPTDYDKTVLKYTEGFKESWCSDFITWVLNQADSPVINPDSKYWRIPGVLTLQQYYKDNDAYALADSGYTPELGDVVFYIGSQTPDETSGEHAAFVLGIMPDNKLITIGGNEAQGILRIRTESLNTNIAKGMVGYGKLSL